MPSTTLEASVTASLEDTVKPEREIIPPSTVGSNVNEARTPSPAGRLAPVNENANTKLLDTDNPSNTSLVTC